MSRDQFEREALPHLEALRVFASRLCRDGQGTDDLVQETMLKAFTHFGSYADGTNCRAWLFQICKNSYFTQYRRKRLQPAALDFAGPEAGAHAAGNGRSHHAHLLADDTFARDTGRHFGDEVHGALRAIPAEYRTAVILSDLEGFSYREIAAFTSAPIGTIRSRIHRGRRMLAERLDGYAREHRSLR